jgi:hypothetical protein
MSDFRLDLLTPARLAGLLDVDPPEGWSLQDAATALRHQLAAMLLPDLAVVPGIEIDRLRRIAAPNTTFLELLVSRTPEIELLKALKIWARHVRDDSENPLAGAPATVLYYAAVAAARVRLDQRITSLMDAKLRAGCTWALAAAGDSALTSLFEAALAAIPLDTAGT